MKSLEGLGFFFLSADMVLYAPETTARHINRSLGPAERLLWKRVLSWIWDNDGVHVEFMAVRTMHMNRVCEQTRELHVDRLIGSSAFQRRRRTDGKRKESSHHMSTTDPECSRVSRYVLCTHLQYRSEAMHGN